MAITFQMALRERVDKRSKHGVDGGGLLPQVLAPPVHWITQSRGKRDQTLGRRSHELRRPRHELPDRQHDAESADQSCAAKEVQVLDAAVHQQRHALRCSESPDGEVGLYQHVGREVRLHAAHCRRIQSRSSSLQRQFARKVEKVCWYRKSLKLYCRHLAMLKDSFFEKKNYLWQSFLAS